MWLHRRPSIGHCDVGVSIVCKHPFDLLEVSELVTRSSDMLYDDIRDDDVERAVRKRKLGTFGKREVEPLFHATQVGNVDGAYPSGRSHRLDQGGCGDTRSRSNIQCSSSLELPPGT